MDGNDNALIFGIVAALVVVVLLLVVAVIFAYIQRKKRREAAAASFDKPDAPVGVRGVSSLPDNQYSGTFTISFFAIALTFCLIFFLFFFCRCPSTGLFDARIRWRRHVCHAWNSA